ncbi:DUF4190 domain-containing protein [Eubacterium xylanophilum]|uniref:DUF4190 domain-containing protein n=1 Tax=Eubacterium xylanophilum TaxID=39497 RepID=UPI0004B375EE|nr:DUF4190 domain-containing protein [Eubacterium xylanophilum]
MDDSKQGNGFSVAAMVLGICSIVFSCFFPVGLVTGVLGVFYAKKYSDMNSHKKNGMAMAGFVTGIIGTVLNGIQLVAFIIGILAGAASSTTTAFEVLEKFLSK